MSNLTASMTANMTADMTASMVPGAAPPPPAAVTLDAPVKTALIADTYSAHGLGRMVQGYTGNTCRLLRRDDSAESDFGFNEIGALDEDAINTWRGSSDVDVLKVYDQIGNNHQTAVGRARLVDGGVWVRFGVTRSEHTEVLTRSATLGAPGIDTGSDLSYFISDNTYTLTSSEGIESHGLYSLKQDWDVTTPDEQYFVTFGISDNVYLNHGIGPASATDYIRCKTTGGNTVESGTTIYKANGMFTSSLVMSPTDFRLHQWGTTDGRSLTAGTLGSNYFDGSKLVIGAKFTGSGGAIRSDRRANMVWGGTIITKHLGDTAADNLNRYILREKLQAIGYQHRIKSKATIQGYFTSGGGVLMKDIETSGYTVAPFTGTGTFAFNNSTGSPTFTYEYDLPYFGLQGVRSTTDNNDNAFTCADGVPPDLNGTIVAWHLSESSGSNLTQSISVAPAGTEFDDSIDNVSFSAGYDHGAPSTMNMIADDRETTDLIGTRRKADEDLFGSVIYDGANQSMGKYNRNCAHEEMTYGETIDGYVWPEQTWAGTDISAPYLLDAPVIRPLAGNIKSLSKDDALTLQFGTFDAPVDYVKSDPFSTRKLYRLGSVNTSAISQGTLPGMRYGDIAVNYNGSVVDNSPTAQFLSRHGLLQSFVGVRFGYMWSPDVFDDQKIEEVTVNLYKLIEAV